MEVQFTEQLSSPEKARKLMEQAKLDPDECLPYTQTLIFGEKYGDDCDRKLLEIDSELIEYLESGERLIIRGDANEPSVLCTKSKTYEIREAETSNSLLIVPSLVIPNGKESETHSVTQPMVESIHFKYLELKHCQPRNWKLFKLLEEKTYKGSCSSDDFGYKWSDLVNRIQASKEEILLSLKNFKAYFYKDHWCLLEFDYHFGVLSSILNLIDSNSIPLEGLCKSEVIETLKEVEPEPLLNQCFDYFFDKSEDGDLFKIKGDDVCRFCAEVLLKPAGKFNLNEFLSIWQQSVPEGLQTSLSQLKGVALVDSASMPPVIWHFPKTLMPVDVVEGFALLFETRKKWRLEDISPYLENYKSPKVNVSALLTKYARTSTVDGVRVYSSRHSS